MELGAFWFFKWKTGVEWVVYKIPASRITRV